MDTGPFDFPTRCFAGPSIPGAVRSEQVQRITKVAVPHREIQMRSDDLRGVIGVSDNATTFVKVTERIVSSAHVRDVDRLRRIAQRESLPPPQSDSAEIERLRLELEQLRSSKSWRYTAPLRSIVRWLRARRRG